MKKIVFILLGMLFILSCQDQLESMKQPQVGADGKVEVEFTVQIPEVQLYNSRALTEKPYIFHLYLAVFDEAGYLLEYVKADVDPAVENNEEYNYKVKLSPTSYPTAIHYIANGPTSVSFGTETEVVGNMSTWGETDAYWQKVYLPEGIKVDDDGLDSEVQNKLSGIRLIRNFSWIKLNNQAQNFELESFCVINTRDKGSVAAYNTATGKFVNFKDSITHDSLVANGYEAYIPGDAELNKQIPLGMYWGTDYFIYERERPKSDPMYILMKGTYTPENGEAMPGRYYKVDLRDAHGDYFPVLRNFRYQVNLKNIKHPGHATPEAAAQGAGSGDVSTSIETENLNNISNSVIRLWVSYTDRTLVSSDPDTLRYKFVNLANANTSLNDSVSIEWESLSADNKVVDGCQQAEADDSDGWRTITIYPVSVSDQRKTQTLTLKGSLTVGGQTYTLQRKVQFTLRGKMVFDLVCDPDAISETMGEPFDLVIKVPGGLGSSLFPLDFEIEAVAQTITPNLGDNLPVVTGKSIVPNKNKTTIGFIKSISWNEYEDAGNEGGFKPIRCHFKSNRAESATMIYAQNEYFTLDSVLLANYEPGEFTDLAFDSDAITDATKTVTFSFKMSRLPSQGYYVTVTLDGLEPVDGEQKLTYLGVKDGRAQYKYEPTNKDDNEFQLQPTVESGSMNVKLEAYRFTPAEKSIAFGYVIPAGHIKVGNNSNIANNTVFYLYSSNPGRNTNVTSFGSFIANKNGSNSHDIIVSNEVYEQIKDNGKVYVRFTKTERNWFGGTTTTYYVAEVNWDYLINGTAGNLNFRQQ